MKKAAMIGALLLAAVSASPQASPSNQGRTFVEFVPMNTVLVRQGHPVPVAFTFRVVDPYHINSHTPSMPELIPTEIHFSLPGELVIGRIVYPAGKLTSFPFSPEQKLSVYSGETAVKGLIVPTTHATVGPYTIHGELRYQACDNNACYPPKKLPFQFDVKITTGPAGTRRPRPNAQSPHIH